MSKARSQNGKGRGVFIISVGKSTGKTSLGRPRRKLEQNARKYLKEINVNKRN